MCFSVKQLFWKKNSDKARAKDDHLTARQAGVIARKTGVKALNIFHFSPQYEECPESLENEAQLAFKGG